MALLTRMQVDRARRESILAVAERLGLRKPLPRGHEYAVLCPLHDDTNPSLLINAEKGVWFCHPCREGGDTIRLVMRARNLDFADAVRWITGS